ncbi:MULTISPECIES: DegT/DnrJ/EryC1/StrS family aminotransferase [Niastella]|uniref:DegT/DnrJ/EryC1/StrS family aminotransferase n=1 Tax=Niastella soli TaxID=2821487 RepID=A0ABS3YQH5_9BACT|nr:DegT/DnrJ/EryC1/StrS family aminotransferase [Niastella soli]MBO9200138.1 DegT/DnrJ/EryC1/StrS family aminotransferase [Niastella soli]
MINVTKTFLPPFEEYTAILKKAWDKAWITNNGELLLELEKKLKDYLSVDYLFYCNNGTLVLQMALKALGITKEVITTPFSYVATTNTILWEGCKPVFVDIDPHTFCIDAYKIEAAITENTQAILATHVYGIPCDVEKIQAIAEKHNLKVIYDGAHAFGSQYKGKSLLSFGDISTCSFHATKVFHTVEGGCLICHDAELAEKMYFYRSFGHIGDDYYSVGINAKNSEFHAAMGLANLQHFNKIVLQRKAIAEYYDECLKGFPVARPKVTEDVTINYSYYPIVFDTEEQLLKTTTILKNHSIFPRRYFYPSLNTLPFITSKYSTPNSESISRRVLCLPLYYDLAKSDVDLIVELLFKSFNK